MRTASQQLKVQRGVIVIDNSTPARSPSTNGRGNQCAAGPLAPTQCTPSGPPSFSARARRSPAVGVPAKVTRKDTPSPTRLRSRNSTSSWPAAPSCSIELQASSPLSSSTDSTRIASASDNQTRSTSARATKSRRGSPRTASSAPCSPIPVGKASCSDTNSRSRALSSPASTPPATGASSATGTGPSAGP